MKIFHSWSRLSLRMYGGVYWRRWCSSAQETDPICSRPACVDRNSSKYGPRGAGALPLWSLHLLPLCLITGRVECQGHRLNPQVMRGGGGLVDSSINVDSMYEMTQSKWCFLGRFYACVSAGLGLWQGGEPRLWGRVCWKRDATVCLVWSLVHVLLELPRVFWRIILDKEHVSQASFNAAVTVGKLPMDTIPVKML